MARERKTKTVDFQIVTCTGVKSHLVRMRIPVDADPWDYDNEAIRKSGLKNYVCGSCYDNAYHVSTRKVVE